MTNNEQKALEQLQIIRFDAYDLLAGDSYQSLGYEGRRDFLETLIERLDEIEGRLIPEEVEA